MTMPRAGASRVEAVGDAGRYRLDEPIATGGMGQVWRATDTVLDRQVAVKVLKNEYADDPLFRTRFASEARHAAALHHPGVASVFDYGEVGSNGPATTRPFLVMELVPGQPLSALLRRDEPMPPATAMALVAQAADAIAAAHALGIVHRDVKPANLLVTPDGKVKITDFGIARAADAVALTNTGDVIGTPHYISPEQAEGKPATAASDIYALGVVLYECLAGRRPFASDTPIGTALAHLRQPVPPLPDDLPERARQVTMKALEKAAQDRFSSASELAAALRGAPILEHTKVLPAAGVAAGAAVGGAALAPTLVATGVGAPADGRRQGLARRWPLVAALAVLLLIGVVTWALADGDDAPNTDEAAATPNSTPTGSSDGQTNSEPSGEPSGEQTGEPSGEPSDEPTDDASESASEPEPEGVQVDPADYVGSDADEAQEQLEDLGLQVDQDLTENPDGNEEGTVASLSPTGLVALDDEVTLLVWDSPPDSSGEGDGEEGD